jgi:hypothetical protein
MAITYEKVTQEVLNLLGGILGASPATAEANYSTSPSTSTVIGPDFLPSQVLDAIATAQGEIAEAIATTPLHPERTRFADVTSALANRDAMPRTGANTGKLIIGVPGGVKDSSNSKALLPVDLDKVRSFTEFAGTVYSGFEPYWYAINSVRIEHTRTAAIVEVCVYERPTSLTGNIDLDDHHEGGLIAGAVAKLALKESMFDELYTGASKAWDTHLSLIRAYGQPALYGAAQAAPSST